MRKYDTNAIFNICLKTVLFVVVSAGFFCLFRFLFGAPVIIAAVISLAAGLLAVMLFSFALRYTRFYYFYYSAVSMFLFREKTGEVYCPCCGKHFRQFRDERYYDDASRYNPAMFSKQRQAVICDFCRSAPRHRIIASWAEDNTDLLRSSKILYFAPELSMMLWFRRHGIKVITADLYDRRTDLRLDLTDIALPDGSEDIVFCNHVLEHVPDYSLALSELHRIIRKGGMLIISFPIDPGADDVREDTNASVEERIRLFGQNDHFRVFGMSSSKILEDAGFEVDTVSVGGLPDDIMPVTGPADYDTNTIFCCVKK